MLLEAMTGEVLVSTKPLEEGKFHEDLRSLFKAG